MKIESQTNPNKELTFCSECGELYKLIEGHECATITLGEPEKEYSDDLKFAYRIQPAKPTQSSPLHNDTWPKAESMDDLFGKDFVEENKDGKGINIEYDNREVEERVEEKGEKPAHAKPQLYAQYFLQMQGIAKDCGYNLVVHGSMARDLDLIAIPWVDDPNEPAVMIRALCDYLGGRLLIVEHEGSHGISKPLPGGRRSYVINLNRGGYKRNEADEIADPIEYTPDPEYYIDISVTPLLKP